MIDNLHKKHPAFSGTKEQMTHGCEQSESIMAYAMSDRKRFIK